MKKVIIYTDGACSGNPGPGGWGAVLIYGEARRELSGYDPATTNNRMELLAVIKGLEAIRWHNAEVHVYSDSSYVVNAINKGWLENWKKKGWRKADKSAVLNDDLWKELDKLLSFHNVEFIWVRGHDGHEYNERCDELASGYAEKLRTE